MITASKSRQKHQQELIHSALLTEEISKRVARENFALSTVPILSSASYALLSHQSKDEDDDGLFCSLIDVNCEKRNHSL